MAPEARSALDAPAGHRATGPNDSAQASMARCPTPETLKCSTATTPPRSSSTAALSDSLCGSIPTMWPTAVAVVVLSFLFAGARLATCHPPVVVGLGWAGRHKIPVEDNKDRTMLL